jgi:hypothetical protein
MAIKHYRCEGSGKLVAATLDRGDQGVTRGRSRALRAILTGAAHAEGDADMPSQAMQHAIDALRDRQRAGAGVDVMLNQTVHRQL